jgi:hypothetical protein
MRTILLTALTALPLLYGTEAPAQVERIWLTHRTHNPSRIVVNWTSQRPGNSVVRFGTTPEKEESVTIDESTTLHHVEIPLAKKGGAYHYVVSSGNQRSSEATFKGYPADRLRVAVVADWHGRPDLTAIEQDDVHLLLTAGDNIPSIHGACVAGQKDCIKPYAALIDAYPRLFRSTPFLPVLGNHDKEVRPRGTKPPVEPVYDVDATAFRTFFELPDDEWKWHFDVPDFGVRFLALDLNHLGDFGTTWQSCHAFQKGSPQYEWYRKLVNESPQPFVVTLFNEKNSTVRGLEGGDWGRMLQRGSAVITGFGHFAERAVVDGVPYYNTSLQGRGDRYPDPKSAFLASEDNYLLLTFDRKSHSMTIELKGLDGRVLDRQQFRGRSPNSP